MGWKATRLALLLAAALAASPSRAEVNALGFTIVPLTEAMNVAVERAINAVMLQPDGTRFRRPYGAVLTTEGVAVCALADMTLDNLRTDTRIPFLVLLREGKATQAEVIAFPADDREDRALFRYCRNELGIDLQ